MNAPTLYDRFIVPEGHRKVAFVPDTKVASAGTFTVQREDHTLGNLIRMQLHTDDKVLFAGYQLPHPLVNELKIKIQTRPGVKTAGDEEYTPQRALHASIDDLQTELRTLRAAFASEVQRIQEQQRQ